MTLKEKIFDYFSTHNVGRSANTFAAFCLLLRCLNYNISSHFAYALCGLSPKQYRKLHYDILMNKIAKVPSAYKSNNVNGFILFFMFIDLGIKLSKDICHFISSCLNKNQYKDFDCLCQIYFNAIKCGIINDILYRDEGERVLYFIEQYGRKNFISKRVSREFGVKKSALDLRQQSFYDNIGRFDCKYTDSNRVWDDVITRKIKSIPMGGQNKRR